MTRRVMIVEDDKEIRDSIVELFEDEGYGIEVASNGEAALTVLRGATELPGVVLLDLMMPDMDGFQFRAEQLKDPRLAQVPILLMSAGADLADKASRLGAQGYLRKPFRDLDQILTMVDRFFASAT
jgi:CheY-like chemotaxis protein